MNTLGRTQRCFFQPEVDTKVIKDISVRTYPQFSVILMSAASLLVSGWEARVARVHVGEASVI